MLKQQLQQKLGLKINPLQIQLIKLLELPTYQLEQRIKEELESNPLLEEGRDEESYQDEPIEQSDDTQDDSAREDEDFSLDDYMHDSEDDVPDYKLSANNHSKDDTGSGFMLSDAATFRDNLMEQLGLLNLTETERNIAEYIIGNIDEDGYLRREIEQIADDIAFSTGEVLPDATVIAVLQKVQQLEPAGVGARDLRESLMLQLQRKIEENSESTILTYALGVISDCFEEFSKKHYEKIARKLRITDDQLKEAMNVVLKLNPKPGGSEGSALFDAGMVKIIPDFTLDLIDGELQLSLNEENVPELRVNRSYLELLDSYKDKGNTREKKDVVSFVKYKLTAAKGFIDAIQQRNNTLMLTMSAIVQLQKEFFLTGDESKRRPMILKDVADVTGLDVSTISRVSNSKYVQCWFGIYALKDFFSGSMQTTAGEEVSTDELKSRLKELVDHEDKQQPLTDDELVSEMEKKGYKIARRTVAKYRQMLDIPVARLRREM
ncbi:MAG: RNA polymerase factor sigma-54 [Marinifilaceae bacterium]